MKVDIDDHSIIDKRFDVMTEHLCLMVDFDDVNHAEVDAAVLQLKKIVEEHWNEELHEKLYLEELMKIWNENKNNIQRDYEDEGGLTGYLQNFGIN